MENWRLGKGSIGWRHFAEGRATKHIKDMQIVCIYNRNVSYTVEHSMRDLVM